MRSPHAILLSLAALGAQAMDAGLSFEELCMKNGYMTEQYQVITEDDYILSLYRIPGKFTEARDKRNSPKPAVLFVHALDANMMEYVLNDADKANAFILVNEGYDVWLGNNRGSQYSHGHLTLSTDSRDYWDYWTADLGLKDVPTFIDHILETTGLPNLSYIGHSQGTTQFFLGASMNPSYFKEKVNLFVALAPVGSTAHIPYPELKWASKHVKEIELAVVDGLHQYNWFPQAHQASMALDSICGLPVIAKFCELFVDLFVDEKIDNVRRLEVGLPVFPSGQTWRTFVYYAQAIRTGNWTLYDYGPIKNKQVYGQKDAPPVPIQDYDVPTVLLSGDKDKLATPEDVAWLSEQLGDKVVFQKQYHLNHVGFVLANDMSFFSVDAVA